MHASVRAAFVAFSDRFEGTVRTMYNDVRGLTTVAIGCLIDPMPAALALEWVRKDGTVASSAEVAACWQAVHNDPKCAKLGWRYAAQLPGNTIKLTDEGVMRAVFSKLEVHEGILSKRFESWDDLPADAQLAIHSVAWACGANFHFPKFVSAINARDFAVAEIEIHMNEWTTDANGARIKNAGLVPRNVANKMMMRTAGRVFAWKLDPEVLHYPSELEEAPVCRQEFKAAMPVYVDEGGSRIVSPEDLKG